MDQNQTPTPSCNNDAEHSDTTIVKRKNNISEEERQRRSDRMRALAKSRNEMLQKQKAERLAVAPAPEPAPEPAPVPEPAPKKAEKSNSACGRKPKKVVKKVKQVIVQSSSDSEDYGDSESGSESEEEEVIYITKEAKKSRGKMTKDKAVPVRQPLPTPVPEAPQVRIKFI
jgi:hypothetical protein